MLLSWFWLFIEIIAMQKQSIPTSIWPQRKQSIPSPWQQRKLQQLLVDADFNAKQDYKYASKILQEAEK